MYRTSFVELEFTVLALHGVFLEARGLLACSHGRSECLNRAALVEFMDLVEEHLGAARDTHSVATVALIPPGVSCMFRLAEDLKGLVDLRTDGLGLFRGVEAVHCHRVGAEALAYCAIGSLYVLAVSLWRDV
jgi:hypothetical protein